MRMQQGINNHPTNTPKKVLLSLHGFHSSPASLKAQQMREYLQANHPDILFLCPQLPALPKDMWALICDIFKQYQHSEIAVMGSSLGGFLATKVEETYQVKSLLINPAVSPSLLFTKYAGEQVHPYLNERYEINNDYMQQLIELKVESFRSPDNIWVLLQEEDEVLDYREALNKYQGCKITCEKGGNHSFLGFDRYLTEIIDFLY